MSGPDGEAKEFYEALGWLTAAVGELEVVTHNFLWVLINRDDLRIGQQLTKRWSLGRLGSAVKGLSATVEDGNLADDAERMGAAVECFAAKRNAAIHAIAVRVRNTAGKQRYLSVKTRDAARWFLHPDGGLPMGKEQLGIDELSQLADECLRLTGDVDDLRAKIESFPKDPPEYLDLSEMPGAPEYKARN